MKQEVPASCCHNHMDDGVCAGKDRPRVSSTEILGDLSFVAKIKQQYKIAKELQWVAKSWHRVAQGLH